MKRYQQKRYKLYVQLQFQYQFAMKKTKIEINQVPISLASKRASLNQDKLAAPYKIDWNNQPLQNMQNKSKTNKTFFQNMKQELSTIKNDFQKLLKKQSSFNSTGKPVRQQQSYAIGTLLNSSGKGKSMSSYKKQQKKMMNVHRFQEPDKFQIVMAQKDINGDNYHNKFYNGGNQIHLSDKKQNNYKTQQHKQKQYYSNNHTNKYISKYTEAQFQFPAQQVLQSNLYLKRQSRTPIQKESYNRIEKESYNRIDTRNDQKEKENGRLKELIAKLNQQIAIHKKDKQSWRTQCERIVAQKQLFMQKMSDLSKQLTLKLEYAQRQEQQIKELTTELKQKRSQSQESAKAREQMDKERTFYNERINQLMFHNQNFHNFNCELGQQNQQLKQSVNNMQAYIESLKGMSQNNQNDYQRKIQFLKKDLEQYDKREIMFAKQIQKMNELLCQKTNQSSNNIQPYSFGLICQNCSQTNLQPTEDPSQIQNLKKQIIELSDEVNLQKSINCTLSEKYESQLKKLQLSQFASGLQQKINTQLDQNTKIKRRVNILQAELQSVKEQNHSFTLQIQLYQERQKRIQINKKLTSSQWEELTQQIDQLRQQNKQLVYQLQHQEVIKDVNLETPITTQATQNQEILILAHTQLAEIESLKNIIKDLQSLNNTLSQQLALKNLIGDSKQEQTGKGQSNPNNSSARIVEEQGRSIMALKQLIFKVIVEKVSKLEEQREIDYYFRKLQEYRRQWLGELTDQN